ncbi:MAG: hypothetical protein K2N91_00540 [Muribaculaceae bacterium]|nr:hypothetical protein [Muribaculaceae bacterium]
MEPITIIGGIVLLVTATVATAITHYRNKIAKTNAALAKFAAALTQYAEAYQFEECDKPMISAVKNYIDTLRCKGNLATVMESMDMADRKSYIHKVVREIASLMKIELSDINIVDLGPYLFGQSYIEAGKYKVDLNEAMLVADPDRLLQTACHELRHLQQMQALENDKWGFSINRKAQWMAAFNNYVNNEDGSKLQYIAYVMQSIEVDANKFAIEVAGDNR